MKNKTAPIIVEKLGVSDDYYTITKLFCENGSEVKENQLILCIESSKASEDIMAPTSGYIFFNVEENEEVQIGQKIAVISNNNSFDPCWFNLADGPKKKLIDSSDKSLGIRISRPAQRLIDKNNIDISIFKDKSIITKEDIEIYLSKQKKIVSLVESYDKSDIFILGGGGHGKMCVEIINKMTSYKLIGIVDSKLQINDKVLGVPIIGNENVIDELISKGLKNVILGIGAVLNHQMRRKIYTNLKEKGLFIPNIIHPSASIESSVEFGNGNQIMQGAIIGSNVKIGDNCIINSGSIISHDSIIGNNIHIAPGAIIAGNVKIDDDSIIGMGVTLFLGINIGRNVVINNGINVFQDIQDNEVVK